MKNFVIAASSLGLFQACNGLKAINPSRDYVDKIEDEDWYLTGPGTGWGCFFPVHPDDWGNYEILAAPTAADELTQTDGQTELYLAVCRFVDEYRS